MGQAEEIKSKLDIVEVIREYIPVKAVGANFQALCPFHNEKTPSFVISPDKQIWHCFGCSRGGDVFTFVMEKEGLSFVEALRLLAPKAGVVLSYDSSESYSERNRLLDILELSGKYYAHLLSTPAGKNSLNYLLKRGLSLDTIKSWQLGYSPDAWDNLYVFLKSRPLSGKKYTDEEIFAAGLIIKKNQEGSSVGRRSGYYDRFRDRIMFPIWDVNNNIIAFTARVNPEKEKTEKMGKYINSPQTAVYDKSRVLFALNKAKAAIRQQDLAIVVEGQMDAISSHQHGFNNIVASSGTALTTEQISLLKRFTTNVALLFDMDNAGQLAADRGIKEVLAQELNLKVIVLTGYKDPDECLQEKPDKFRQAILDAKPMLEYYFEKVSLNLDLDNFDNKRQIRDKMFTMIDLVVNKTEQGYWLKKISEELGFFETDIREEFLKWRTKNSVLVKRDRALKPEFSVSETSREDKLAELLLSLLVKFPEFISYSISNLELEDLKSPIFSQFYKDFIIYYNKVAVLDYENFRIYLKEESEGEEKLLDKLILLGEKNFYNYEAAQVKTEVVNIILELKKYNKQGKIKKLQKAIALAEKEKRKEELEMLMNDLKNLTIS
ncbi:MAG: DNA primase [Patescibacteria group bacterium]|jgi:DNA primase